MNISYNWLKEYVDFDLTPDEVAAALTSIGLETGSVEEVQTVKGGLEGLYLTASYGSSNLHAIVTDRGNNASVLRLRMKAVHKVNVFTLRTL